ncbi:PRC-barrel domain-containing protein [Streptomyces bambusae]|uniref:PRC-barrel domain-containing protein n=1 Tax=Streptomyces bambusae TaxID=1550616 RepID=UPI001CFC933B|nr:PRC-barrel domain-containing protein [Streptomyces bambusae]MCB5164244.1 PRC-barrel domain-containing protein [Streptomyces bambusae]
MPANIWVYRQAPVGLLAGEITGYKVEAQDGSIGKVVTHVDEPEGSYLVVDTGPWIFGKEVLLPAGTIARIDTENHEVHIDRTKDQIKAAPEFDRTIHLNNDDYHRVIGDYHTGLDHRA